MEVAKQRFDTVSRYIKQAAAAAAPLVGTVGTAVVVLGGTGVVEQMIGVAKAERAPSG